MTDAAIPGEQAPAATPRRILYIVGCGRSGSTILGFSLGNVHRAIDLGEVLDFVKFRGCPNGFGPETENHRFWSSITAEVERRLGEPLDFDELRALQSRVDTHWALVRALIPGWRRQDSQAWRSFLTALYDSLLSDPRFDVIVDSSKYPSRLWHLQAVYPASRICIIHLVRNPIAVAASRGTDEQSAPKSFLASILYFIGVNTAARLLIGGAPSTQACTVLYEDFVAEPESQLERICSLFRLDPGNLLKIVRMGYPLHRGYIFNGNRMRMRDTIVLQRGRTAGVRQSWFKRRLGDFLLFFYRPNDRGQS